MTVTEIAEIGHNGAMRHEMAQWAEAGTLATRQRGGEARIAIEREIEAQPSGAPVVLSFTNILDMTHAFAEESIVKLIADRLAGFYEDHPLLAVDVSDDVHATISAVLRARGLVLLAFGPEPMLLGGADHLEQTLAAAVELGGEFSVAELASKLGLTAPAANNRVSQLRQSGVLTRARVIPTRGGNEYRYKLAEPDLDGNGSRQAPRRGRRLSRSTR